MKTEINGACCLPDWIANQPMIFLVDFVPHGRQKGILKARLIGNQSKVRRHHHSIAITLLLHNDTIKQQTLLLSI